MRFKRNVDALHRKASGHARLLTCVNTLMVIFAANGGYVVGWGSEAARDTVTLEAQRWQ